jgi:alpha-tubulin suppressor-like RCC1 family protein
MRQTHQNIFCTDFGFISVGYSFFSSHTIDLCTSLHNYCSCLSDLTGGTFQLTLDGIILDKTQLLSDQGIEDEDTLHAIRQRRICDPGPEHKTSVGEVLIYNDSRHHLDRVGDLRDMDIVDISAGFDHCAAISADGTLYTYGVNNNSTLGCSSDPEILAPVEGLVNMAKVCCGRSFTAALDTDGCLYAWGTFEGKDGTTAIDQSFRVKPVKAKLRSGEVFVAIAAGLVHLLALTSRGRVFTWGHGTQHQLGRCVIERRAYDKPRLTALALTDIVYIACGDFNSFAVNKDGVVYAWGLNDHEQTGIPLGPRKTDACFVKMPTVVSGLQEKGKVVQIAAAKEHTLVLMDDGTITSFGARGEEVNVAHTIAQQETNLSDVREIAAGPDVDLALTGDGHVFLRVVGGCVWEDQSCRGLAVVPGMVLAVRQKQLLVLDLNGVLIDKASWTARPYLEEFLEFVFKHFDVMVWSSGQPHTVKRMLDTFFGPYKTQLVKTWTRDNFELTPEEYNSKCLTVKDLDKVWADCDGRYGAHNTILIDDSEEKAQKQPNNLVLALTFEPRQADVDRELEYLREHLLFLTHEEDVSQYIKYNPL